MCFFLIKSTQKNFYNTYLQAYFLHNKGDNDLENQLIKFHLADRKLYPDFVTCETYTKLWQNMA